MKNRKNNMLETLIGEIEVVLGDVTVTFFHSTVGERVRQKDRIKKITDNLFPTEVDEYTPDGYTYV